MSKIEPALTAEEWEDVRKYGLDHVRVGYGPQSCFEEHGAAALCLHGQPFGFTREDVMKLRSLKPSGLPGRMFTGVQDPQEEALRFLANIADRIEALLPPEAP